MPVGPLRDGAYMSPMSITTQRANQLERLAAQSFDVVVVGGGATGLGIAVDASLRGLKVALLEAYDFGKGTSSRATKLIHGGVRYLAQGRISLVRESLRERSALLRNAPHLVRPLPFVVPLYRRWELPFFGAGLSIYGALAGRHGLGPTRFLSAREVQRKLPGVHQTGLKGGIEYWDAQFDDAGLAIALARSADDLGAVVVNYAAVTGALHEAGKIVGVQVNDRESDRQFPVRARCVINATGVWVDTLRQQDAGIASRPFASLVKASRGSHLVVDRCFFPSDSALLVPRTPDGRVFFIVPWQGKVLLGTTDVATTELAVEPVADPSEIDYILDEAGRYLQKPISRQDVKSTWAGLRPLVNPGSPAGGSEASGRTAALSREHSIEVSASGLVTVAGGKWTTYRSMAQDALEACVEHGLLPALPPCQTEDFALADMSIDRIGGREDTLGELHVMHEQALQEAGVPMSLIYNAVVYEYARTVEDILARRSRLLFLEALSARNIAPIVAEVMQKLTGVDPQLHEFLRLSEQYIRRS